LESQSDPTRRRPRWLPLAATLVGVAVTLAAGNWQLNRAAEKQRLQAAYERGASDPAIRLGARPTSPEQLRLRRVEAVGEFVPQAMVLLDNRIHRGTAGYHVIMPLRIAGTPVHVLVNRGWIAAGTDRSRPPAIDTPAGTVRIEGIAVMPGRFLELAEADLTGVVWQNLTIERFIAGRGLQVQPIVVEQTNAVDDGLVRDWPRPDFGIEKHYSYAAQWFIFCGLIVILFAYFHVRNARSNKS
jgi:surfeit locus 1 family protein